jgi:uncharacterized membrane protein HdeD (DUF308 family)
MFVQIDSPGRRAAAYWFADGLPEILFGFFFLIPGALVFVLGELHTQIQQHRWIGGLGLLVGLLGWALWFVHRPILNFLKARITYPRTGYVHPPVDFPIRGRDNPELKILTPGTSRPADENVSSFTRATIPWMCSGVLFMGFLYTTNWGLPLVMSGIAVGIYFLNRESVRPYSWLAVLPIALAGFIASALNLEPSFRVYAPMLICGIWLLVVGIRTLVGYLRANPKQHLGQEGRL